MPESRNDHDIEDDRRVFETSRIKNMAWDVVTYFTRRDCALPAQMSYLIPYILNLASCSAYVRARLMPHASSLSINEYVVAEYPLTGIISEKLRRAIMEKNASINWRELTDEERIIATEFAKHIQGTLTEDGMTRMALNKDLQFVAYFRAYEFFLNYGNEQYISLMRKN